MTRKWKPGDVALIGSSIAFRTEHEWRYGDGSAHTAKVADAFDSIRPLVVIDPEDREQVERLTETYEDERPSSTDLSTHMQAALRSLVTPPRPDEPQGLGAVVEDAEGRRWVRFSPDPGRRGGSYCWAAPDQGAYSRIVWADIAAVRVLSDGVTS